MAAKKIGLKTPTISGVQTPVSTPVHSISSRHEVEEGPTKNAIFYESNAGDGTEREEQYLHGVSLGLCIISLFLAVFLVALDQTIVMTMLETVGTKFNALNNIGWLASGFFLSMAVFSNTWGKLSIIFGRKSTVLVALIIFEAGSLMSALAPNMNTLIGGRVIQGVGGGGIQTLVFVIVSEVVPIENRPLTMSGLGGVFAIASVMGPLVGGAFTSKVTWRWCFYINLPIGAVAFVFLVIFFNPPRRQISTRDKLRMIDFPGVIFLTVGLTLILLALSWGGSFQYAWKSPAIILSFVLGGLSLILFGVWNFKFSKEQLIPTDVVAIPQVVAAAIVSVGMFAFFMATSSYIILYFQIICDETAWRAGVHLLPLILPVVFANILFGILVTKFRFVKPFILFGSILGPVGCGLLILLKQDSSSGDKIGLLIVVGFATGFQMQPSMIAAQISAPKTPGSTIMTTSLIAFSRSLGGALGANLAVTVYNASFTHIFKRNIMKLGANSGIPQELSKYNVREITASTRVLQSLSVEARRFVKTQMLLSMKNVYIMSIGIAGISLIASLFVTNKRLPEESRGVVTESSKQEELEEKE